jgi:hypothetical protein
MNAAHRFKDPRALPVRQRDRLTALKREYEQGWRTHHELLGENMLPFAGRFFIDDRNYGDRRHGTIIDSTPLTAVRTLSAGLMSGATSPARVWFRLAVRDALLNEDPEVQKWLSEVNSAMLSWIGSSNLYHALHRAYEEMAVFGTSVILLLPDDEKLFHAYGAACGQYYLDIDAQERVNVCYREFQLTVAATVREFGYERCSESVQKAFDNEDFNDDVHVVHAIEPNDDRYREGSTAKEELKYRSTYFEFSHVEDDVEGRTLRDGGFAIFPVLAFRWNVSGGDVYGHSPGMECLGDCVQLQHEQERKGQCIDFQTRPPLQIPPSLKHSEVDGQPGGTTTVPASGREGGIRPLFEVRLDLNALREDISDVRVRIGRTMFTDLFVMLQQVDKTMTAREVITRNEEKLLMLGPMLERLFDDGLKPTIDLIFYYLAESGNLPPPPQSMSAATLDVLFVSPLAQAQRGIGINAVDRFLQTVGALSSLKPNALDNIAEDKVVRAYADILGIDPDLLEDPEVVAQLRAARAQQQAAMDQAAAMQQAGAGQKSMAEAAAAAPVDAITQATGYTNPAAAGA